MMKAIHAGVLGLMLALTAIPAANGQIPGLGACVPPSTSATPLPDGLYLSLPRLEMWQEDNGFPGLQIRAYGCDDGSTIGADQCLSGCPLGYVLYLI